MNRLVKNIEKLKEQGFVVKEYKKQIFISKPSKPNTIYEFIYKKRYIKKKDFCDWFIPMYERYYNETR